MDSGQVKSVLLADFNERVLKNPKGNLSINALECRCNVSNLDLQVKEGEDISSWMIWMEKNVKGLGKKVAGCSW